MAKCIPLFIDILPYTCWVLLKVFEEGKFNMFNMDKDDPKRSEGTLIRCKGRMLRLHKA